MKIKIMVLAALFSVVRTSGAQSAATPVIDLKAFTKIELPTMRGSTMGGGAICDGAGNVYVILGTGKVGTQERAALPIRKITPEGSLAGSFRILDAFPNDISGKPIKVIGRGIFVTRDGRLFQTADVNGETFVVEFAPDGAIKTKTKLVADDLKQAWTWRIAVFDSGQYLLTATTGKDHLVPFTAVFAADGRLVKRIYEPEDEAAAQKAVAADWDSHPVGTLGGVDFVRKGDATVGSDGNVYFLHGTASQALVYVISPVGNVVRKLRIDAGDSGLQARSIKSYGGQIAIQFDKWIDSNTQRNLLMVTDLRGTPIANYRIERVEGNHSLYLTGYGIDGFTFLPYYRQEELYLVKERPQ